MNQAQWIVIKRLDQQVSLVQIGEAILSISEDLNPKDIHPFVGRELITDSLVISCHPSTLKRTLHLLRNSTIKYIPVPRTKVYGWEHCLFIPESEFTSFIKQKI